MRARWAAALESFKASGAGGLPPDILATLGLDAGGWSATLPTTAFFEALEQTSLAISISDPNAIILYVNSAFEALTGFPLQNVIGHKHSINAHNKTPLTIYKAMWETILGGETWNGRLLNRRSSGEAYVADLTITPIHGEDGAIRYFLGIHADVTELHQLERKTANQKHLIESVINLAPVVMALVDTDGKVILDNLAYKTLMGDLKGEEPATVLLRTLAPDLGGDLGQACRLNKNFSNIEVSIEMSGDRGPRWFSCSGEWVKEFDIAPDTYFERATQDALLLCCTDITPQRREWQRARYGAIRATMLEQQMAQRVREIVSAAVFQIQGPLNVVRALTDMFRRQQKNDPSIEAALAQVLESGEQAIQTLGNALPQGGEEPETNIHLNELLRDVLVVSMEPMSAADISVDWYPSKELVKVQGRANALRNVFKNIFDNALEAIELGGDTWRKVRVVTQRHADQVEISIEDTGPGMSREVRSRAFEPFYTGWPQGCGKTGMGLAIARQIVDEHRGVIEIDDRYRSGSRIRILLPTSN